MPPGSVHSGPESSKGPRSDLTDVPGKPKVSGPVLSLSEQEEATYFEICPKEYNYLSPLSHL